MLANSTFETGNLIINELYECFNIIRILLDISISVGRITIWLNCIEDPTPNVKNIANITNRRDPNLLLVVLLSVIFTIVSIHQDTLYLYKFLYALMEILEGCQSLCTVILR
jgi:hypothetical protein